MRHHSAALTLTSWLALGACSSSDGGADSPNQVTPPPPDPGAAPPGAPSALFVLGDSLSDVGNAAALSDSLLSLSVDPPTVGLCNPVDVLVSPRRCDDLFYRQSRVTDGPTAVEHLAAHLGVGELAPSMHFIADRPVAGTNYAVAGGKARGRGQEDLAHQVDVLVLDHGLPLPADALYVVMIGGNDAIDAFQVAVAGDDLAAAGIVTAAVTAIGENVERLLGLGARRLVVANVPDLSTLPGGRAEARTSGNASATLAMASAITDSFDRELDALLDEIERRWLSPVPLELARFDLREALRSAENAAATGGGNALDACFDSATYRDSPTGERLFHPHCAPIGAGAVRFGDFVYWDEIHPTGAAHAVIGEALIELLSVN